MYGIFTYIYHKNPLNVGKYTIHMDGMGLNNLGSEIIEVVWNANPNAPWREYLSTCFFRECGHVSPDVGKSSIHGACGK